MQREALAGQTRQPIPVALTLVALVTGLGGALLTWFPFDPIIALPLVGSEGPQQVERSSRPSGDITLAPTFIFNTLLFNTQLLHQKPRLEARSRQRNLRVSDATSAGIGTGRGGARSLDSKQR